MSNDSNNAILRLLCIIAFRRKIDWATNKEWRFFSNHCRFFIYDQVLCGEDWSCARRFMENVCILFDTYDKCWGAELWCEVWSILWILCQPNGVRQIGRRCGGSAVAHLMQIGVQDVIFWFALYKVVGRDVIN